jgi:hypothetical protein
MGVKLNERRYTSSPRTSRWLGAGGGGKFTVSLHALRNTVHSVLSLEGICVNTYDVRLEMDRYNIHIMLQLYTNNISACVDATSTCSCVTGPAISVETFVWLFVS